MLSFFSNDSVSAVDENQKMNLTGHAGGSSSSTFNLSSPWKPTTALTAKIDKNTVYERYFQQVTLQDFLNSKQLQKHAQERNMTPSYLFYKYSVFIQLNNIENSLANLIRFLSITSKNPVEEVKRSRLLIDEQSQTENIEPPKNWLEFNKRTYPLPRPPPQAMFNQRKKAEMDFELKHTNWSMSCIGTLPDEYLFKPFRVESQFDGKPRWPNKVVMQKPTEGLKIDIKDYEREGAFSDLMQSVVKLAIED